ncbi:1,3-beta-galactosyl-N-acetylhexosamine phosphorylase [Bifidobacterium pseudolongum]|uniref:1,3-beta-galactosyl-N-acetylhexosamine phosphorylase n=1 Tax=Bifidobacterium pseudolongum TaxID=1694 RepID=UPI001F0F1628|nr:1,3-beta-galactosyl-N-acetylhexosamine phosphorylase [Bifidobacterium pseudolongum]MCH4843336.1 1,3-beta-galactosyl-N-acetylhexosamine phosphorylase [Bifidobacterium pseudolongum]
MTTTGRFTLPSEENFAEETKRLARLWGADAIRNSDGTHLDAAVEQLGKKIYSAYFPTRAHNEWISLHMDETPQVYLLTQRVLAESDTVTVGLMERFYTEQLQPNRDADPHRYWEAIDRTTGEVIDPDRWDFDAGHDTVTIRETEPMHEYTVSFLAYIIWDPVEMYNHLTNDWGDKEHEIPFDIYHPATRDFVFRTFEQWLKDNPQTDVVRFTTFFYQFTLIFDERHREKIVDWFGCACTVSPQVLDDFERLHGYRLRPEDFVDEGCYNSTWRIPRKAQRDWIAFLSTFVRANVKKLVDETHAAGKEAMMFLGDQWIGTEPYMEGFDELGLDAVVGSVGDGTTLRMIADIPGVRYTEGRFLPYFFPDTFHEGNDPSIEGLDNWRKARRAILRSPISRMGYGGYLSLAAKFPKFVDTVTGIANEFRDIHDRTGGKAAEGELNVAILNCWGRMRSWMAFTVAHALPNQQTYSYYGILEALSGMRVNVRFISFDDVLEQGIGDDVDVIINAGPEHTSFSGGDVWRDPRLVSTIRQWVRGGGAFVGVGQPSSTDWQGRFFQLADVLGVDQERFQTLSVDKYWPQAADANFITEEASGVDFGEPVLNTYPINEDVTLLNVEDGRVRLAVNEYGHGRGVYISGLPYSAANARLLERALFYASHHEDQYAAWSSTNPECEVAYFPDTHIYCVVNNTDQAQSTHVQRADGTVDDFELAPSAIAWQELD